MEKIKTIHENKVLINPDSCTLKIELNTDIFKQLQRYEDEWGYVVEKEDGRWVKIEDVLKLFGAEK